MYEFFQAIFHWTWDFLASIVASIQSGFQHLFALLTPLWQLAFGILYLFEKLITVLIMIFKLGFGLLDLVFAVAVGLFKTLYSFLAVPFAPSFPMVDGHEYTAVFFGFFDQWGFSVVPQILMVFIWIGCAWSIMRIVRGGGNS